MAEPVLAGKGGTLQEMVMGTGQVIVTWPVKIAEWATISHTDKAHHANLLFKEEPWGLAPG